LAARLPQARAQQGPDDQYIIIYSLMQQADTLDSSGQPRQALAQYVQVQGDLQKFPEIYPDWNPRIVNFRLKYLAEKNRRSDGETSRDPAQRDAVPGAARRGFVNRRRRFGGAVRRVA